MKKIVYIGGGTGSTIVLGGLKNIGNCALTGIYPITDNGGSTGELLKDNKDLLPMGDLRKMLIFLTDNEIWQDILDYRFGKGKLAGHNLGNIIIANLQKRTGNIEKTIGELKSELRIKDQILPVALKRATLCVELENGQVVKSETKIDEVEGWDGNLGIKKAWIEPKVSINPKVKKAIEQADLIVIGPGDLYTSVGACLCIYGIVKVIQNSKAKKVFVCNLMTKFGQTNNFSVHDHVSVIFKFLGRNILDYVVYNNQKPNEKILADYKKRREDYVKFLSNSSVFDIDNTFRIKFLGANLLGRVNKKKKGDVLKRSLIYHDSEKLARILINLC